MDEAIRLIRSEHCPPDRFYVMDPSALGIEFVDEGKALIGPVGATPEECEQAARRIGVVLLDTEGGKE